MEITLIQDVNLGPQALCAGVTVDVADDQAQAWIAAGIAMAAPAEPAEPAAPAPKKPAAK